MHHAYLYEGTFGLLPELALDARKRFGFTKEGDPDVHIFAHEKFGIDEARGLREVATLKAAAGKALFVVGVSSITTEAQQALLKLFEEPQAGTVFVVLLPPGSIIATLRSRFLPYPAQLGHPMSKFGGKKFLQMAPKLRSEEITKLLKDDEGVKERVRNFLDEVEAELYKHISKSEEVREGLEDIAKVRSYVNDRSPSLKMLLEHLAATLPSV